MEDNTVLNDLFVAEEILKLQCRLNNKNSYDISKIVKQYTDKIENKSLHNSEKYSNLRKDIMNMLWQEGWYQDVGYFRREPKRKDLVAHLTIIIDKHLI
jgi:hypothetical protein